jgi:hypothetical protein
MEYNEYIKLGFTRTDMNDTVNFKQTGYYGYYLTKKINNVISIELYDTDLNKPTMYIQKQAENCKVHRITLTDEMVYDLCQSII